MAFFIPAKSHDATVPYRIHPEPDRVQLFGGPEYKRDWSIIYRLKDALVGACLFLQPGQEGSRFFNVFGPAPESERMELRLVRSS